MRLCTDCPHTLLSSAYLAPVHYYTKLYRSALAHETVIEEQADHYVKQTYRNRCIIAGDDGPIALTIPVTPPAPRTGGVECPTTKSTLIDEATTPPARGAGGISLSKTPTGKVLISEHGNWRHQHWHAIVSAYRSSPYFEYYVDDFYKIFHDQPATDNGIETAQPLLVDFNTALRNFILDALDLDVQIVVNRDSYITCNDNNDVCKDFRETIRPKIDYAFDPTFQPVTYWQVFASRHGFLPNMSIIDLLFNMGPESRIILRNSCSS